VTELELKMMINNTMRQFGLNSEQSRAFILIAEASQTRHQEPLRMLLAGPVGTGKSRVIQAIESLFAQQGQRHRLRLCSFAGVAARNIGGTTLHSALNLNQHRSANVIAELGKMWLGVDFLFIDEVSMVGCNLLLHISKALIEAKGCTEPFGGLHMIFAGDFAQLSPVGQTRLFARQQISSTSQAATVKGQ